jgi:hypothetical protein
VATYKKRKEWGEKRKERKKGVSAEGLTGVWKTTAKRNTTPNLAH